MPVLRFMRRYPTLFHEFPHSRYSNLPCFKLTDTALLLDSQEHNIHSTRELDTVERICRILMMTKSKTIPLQSLQPLKWDLGLPDNFVKSIIPKYPDHFRVLTASTRFVSLQLTQFREEFAVSTLQKSNENGNSDGDYRNFKRGRTALAFPMNFPRGYGAQKKVKAWMDEFQKLPYISPYEDSKLIDPNSDLMEKRVVGVLHEFLSLTIHKKTKRNYLRMFREELNLPHKFTRIFTRYPGIFYLSLKCKTTTVALKEQYRRGKLIDPHPLARLREKYYYVMRTGLIYRGKGVKLINDQDCLLNLEKEENAKEDSEEEIETGDDCSESEVEMSEVDVDSDEE